MDTPEKLELKVHESSFLLAQDTELDVGAKYLLDHPQHADYSPEEARKVLRKIDWLLMPIMTIVITLAAADKIIISNAAVYGMREDAHLVGSEYSWLGSIFYFGYLLMEFPANYLIQKLPVAKVLCASFLAWNTVLMCMAAGNNFAGLGAMRFLLGMGEAFLFPSLTVITTMFYKKSEQPFRTAIWFSGFSSLITGVLSYGVGHAHSSIANWRLLFLVFGAITIFFTCVLFVLLPDSPISCRYFNEREKYIAVHRTIENKTGTKSTVFKKDQVFEGLTDWKTWVMAVFVLSINISNGALVTFAAQIVSGLGYSPIRTTLLGMPTGVFMTLSSWLIALPGLYFPKKFRTVCAGTICLCPLICCALMMTLHNKHGLLVAYYFFYFYWGPYVCMTSLSMANTSGHTKKTIVNTVNFVSYCVSNIIAPQFFLTREAPHYRTGYHAILGFTAAALVSILAYGAGCYMENSRRDKLYGPPTLDFEEDAKDLTDKQKAKNFRYVW
jgi:MFS family permease